MTNVKRLVTNTIVKLKIKYSIFNRQEDNLALIESNRSIAETAGFSYIYKQ